MKKTFDIIILGAGIYGLHAALHAGGKGKRIAVIEYDDSPFSRASFINQARVHNGYHYPRSYSTAIKSSRYFDRFCKDFSFAINNEFEKIYAISKYFSLANAEQFEKFCDAAGIPCERIEPGKYFKKGSVQGAFKTLEYAFDANLIKKAMVEKLADWPNVEIFYSMKDFTFSINDSEYHLEYDGSAFSAPALINATYASVNQLLHKFGLKKFNVKYEIAEVCLCDVSDNIRNSGLTVMDGPFFSVMPFGKTGLHSLTSVTHTPHRTSYSELPTFPCQENNPKCTPLQLENCNSCPAKPPTAWDYMHQISKKYLVDQIELKFVSSLLAIKPILKTAEIDDSRPTLVSKLTDNPTFITVLSGKINTIYDLEEILDERS
ncbi:MAG: FAD-binding oxidoreductase [Ignavibacteriales bacterium]|nr:FAD-binding oxidoreductase [Ignavibacteriales bacterium]